MSQETTRRTFHHELAELEGWVVELAARVSEACSVATEGLLTGESQLAEQVVAAHALVVERRHDIEEYAYQLIARQQPTASDLRTVITVLGLLNEIERIGSLAGHIASAVARVPAYGLTPKLRGLVTRMSDGSKAMLDQALGAYTDRDEQSGALLADLDDEVDSLHSQLLAELFTGAVELELVVELALIARYYERIADHAVAIGQRVGYLVSGNLGGP